MKVLFVLAGVLLFLAGCISNAKPANYICECRFECTNSYITDSYVQNIGMENNGEVNKCLEYAKNSCESQGLELVKAGCENVYSQEEFKKVKGGR